MSVMEADSLRSHDVENPHFCVYRLTHLHLPSMKPEDSLCQKGRVVEWTSRGLGESEGLTLRLSAQRAGRPRVAWTRPTLVGDTARLQPELWEDAFHCQPRKN